VALERLKAKAQKRINHSPQQSGLGPNSKFVPLQRGIKHRENQQDNGSHKRDNTNQQPPSASPGVVESSNQHCEGWDDSGKDPHETHYPATAVGNKTIHIAIHEGKVNRRGSEVREDQKELAKPIL